MVKSKLQCLKGYCNKASLGYIVRSSQRERNGKGEEEKRRRGREEEGGGKQSTKENKFNFIPGTF